MASLLFLSACGGGGSTNAATYTVGGTLSGLSGSGLVLQNNAGDDLAVTSNGAISFPHALSSGAAYAVTVKTQPSSPAQTCTVANGSGTVSTSNVTSVTVTCVVVILTGHLAYISHFNDTAISAFTIDANTGSLTPVPGSPFSTAIQNKDIFDIAISPSGKFLAISADASGGAASTISVFAVNATTGALAAVTGSPFSTELNSGTGDIEFDRTGAYLYTANYVSNNVTVFSVNPTTGSLTKITGSPFAAGTAPSRVVVDPSNKYLLVANSGSDNISVFSIAAATGALTAVTGSPFVTGEFPGDLQFGAGGKFVYAPNYGTDAGGSPTFTGNVWGYTFNSSTGALATLTGSPFSIASNGTATTNSAGTSLYVPVAAGLAAYSINATTGAPNAVAGSPYAAGANPSQASVEPADKFVYLTNTDDGTVTAYAINATTGLLTLVPGSPVTAGGVAGTYSIVTF